MKIKGNEKLDELVERAKAEARRLGNMKVSLEHLFLAFLSMEKEWAVQLLVELGMIYNDTKDKLEKKMAKQRMDSEDLPENIELTLSANAALKRVPDEAQRVGDEKIALEHFVLAVLHNRSCFVTKLLGEVGIDYEMFEDRILREKAPDSDDDDDFGFGEELLDRLPYNPFRKKLPGKSGVLALEQYGTDITKQAAAGELDPIAGREREIERLAQILSRRKKNNPVLIGEPGVGKSAIAEGLALRIVQKKVPCVLFGKRVISLDIASMVAGTKFRGQFEERMKLLLNDLAKNKNVILFIDELHTLVGAGNAGGSLDAANMLKPALARGAIQCIGATTLDEYREHIESDGALERRFQKVLVEAPSMEETVSILHHIKARYENHHNVRYTDDAIEACVKLTMRYLSDRSLPDKAIDALDEAGARAHIGQVEMPNGIEELEQAVEQLKQKKRDAVSVQDFELATALRDEERQMQEKLDRAKADWEKEMDAHRVVVDSEKVAEVVAMMTGVPVKRVAQTESARLLRMREELADSIIGQDEAIDQVVKAIHRSRAGLKDPNRPIGSFIFLGPTGVGKTQLTKVLARYLFDSEDALIRIDMSEYMERHTVSRLVGAPPGYVGYEEGGQLTERVRRKPYSVVLLDEIEKAHTDVYNILLQLLDDGQLTDSLGRKVDFKNTVIIMTSNVGSRQLKDFGRGIGFNADDAHEDEGLAKSLVQKALKHTFSPEFLNRVDDVIMFNSLDREQLRKIVDIELRGLLRRLSELGCCLEVSERAKEFLTDKGYDPQYGARPLKRAIQKYLEDELSELIIQGDTVKNRLLKVDYEGGEKLTIG